MRVIFWDFDGTLVYSNSLWSNSVFHALSQTRVDGNANVKFEDIRKCMATGFTWHTPYEDYSELTDEKWWDFMIDKICNDYINLGVKRKTARLAASKVPKIIKDLNNYTLYDDAFEILEKSVECGNINVLLSNNYPDLDDVLNGLGLSEYFDSVIISAKIGYDKPRKEIFNYAKSKYPNAEYVMIGDSINADIIGGKNVGMRTVLVHNGFDEKADSCCDTLTEIIL